MPLFENKMFLRDIKPKLEVLTTFQVASLKNMNETCNKLSKNINDRFYASKIVRVVFIIFEVVEKQ
jgi:hypothetical protein